MLSALAASALRRRALSRRQVPPASLALHAHGLRFLAAPWRANHLSPPGPPRRPDVGVVIGGGADSSFADDDGAAQRLPSSSFRINRCGDFLEVPAGLDSITSDNIIFSNSGRVTYA